MQYVQELQLTINILVVKYVYLTKAVCGCGYCMTVLRETIILTKLILFAGVLLRAVLLGRIARTTYVDAVYCYRPSSVVCLSVGPIANLKSHYFQPSLSVCMPVCMCVCLTGTSTLQR